MSEIDVLEHIIKGIGGVVGTWGFVFLFGREAAESLLMRPPLWLRNKIGKHL